MNAKQPIQHPNIELGTVLKKWRFILMVTVTLAALTFLISTLIPPVYSSQTEILIVPQDNRLDLYQSLRSSEYAGEVFKRIVQSSQFRENALAANPQIVREFPTDPRERIQQWDKTVHVSTDIEAGILEIEVLYPNQAQNIQLTKAIVNELIENGPKYHDQANLTLKLISGPVYFNQPKYPSVFLNSLLAVVTGVLVAVGAVFIFGESVDQWLYAKPRQKAEAKPKSRNVAPAPIAAEPVTQSARESFEALIQPLAPTGANSEENQTNADRSDIKERLKKLGAI